MDVGAQISTHLTSFRVDNGWNYWVSVEMGQVTRELNCE